MKKKFQLVDLDCASCAAKMENAIKKIDGVQAASVSFIMQKMTIEEQKKAVRSGYDMDIIPSDLATYGTEAKKLLREGVLPTDLVLAITQKMRNMGVVGK